MKVSTKFYFILAAVGFSLNLIWEMAQMYAYEQNEQFSWFRIHSFCTLASVIDAGVTIGIYGLLSRINLSNPFSFYLLAALFGAICATFFEGFAFRFELWKYNRAMPIVPIIGVGLLPFAQLTLLVPLAIWLTQKFKGVQFWKT